MKITEDVWKYAAQQSLTEAVAIGSRMDAKANEFAAGGGELYN